MMSELQINKIYNTDCLELMKQLDVGKNGFEGFDLIIADPPYFKVVKDDWDNQWETEEEYYEWCEQWISEAFRLLKPNGSFYIWNWFDNICHLGYFAKQKGFVIRNLIAWNRGGGRERNNWCSKKEDLLYLTKSNNPTFNLQDVLLPADHPARKMSKQAWDRGKYERKGRKNYNEEAVNPSNVWYDSLVAKNSKEKVNHSTQKPLSVCDRIIRASSDTDDLVYIPFAGSGSEIVSCINNSRNWVASEINELYIDEVINPRIS